MSYSFFLQMLWKQVHNYPMFNLLMDIDSYMFACVNQTAVYEELEDETRRLCDVRPFLPVLKLVTRSCDPAEKLDSKIGVLIGKGNVKGFIMNSQLYLCSAVEVYSEILFSAFCPWIYIGMFRIWD